MLTSSANWKLCVGTAAANEFWPTLLKAPVTMTFRLLGVGGGASGMPRSAAVNLVTCVLLIAARLKFALKLLTVLPFGTQVSPIVTEFTRLSGEASMIDSGFPE